MPFPLLESVLRLFRRPAKSGHALAAAAQTRVDEKLRLHADWLAKLPPAPDEAKPDLQLLLANGRAAAERQQQILGDPTVPPAKPQPTKFTARCGWCLEPFDREPRTPGELEKLRQVLLITGYAVTAPIDICDPCYETALASAVRVNGHTGLLDIGVDNHGPANLLLQKTYR